MNNDFTAAKATLPVLGVGLGYRPPIAEGTLEHADEIDFLEIVSENYIDNSPAHKQQLDRAADFQIIPHGVLLSIGSTDSIDYQYLDRIKRLTGRINAPWWSDHLCFSSVGNMQLHELCPLPFCKEAVRHVAERAKRVQDYVGLPFLLENISSYQEVPGKEMSEADFIAEILEQADCGMLLDVNNVIVTAHNNNFNPYEYIDRLPLNRVVQIHIAGHRKTENLWIDTHGSRIADSVFELLAYVLQRTKTHAILLERDQYFPKFKYIIEEIRRIKRVAEREQPALLNTKQFEVFRKIA